MVFKLNTTAKRWHPLTTHRYATTKQAEEGHAALVEEWSRKRPVPVRTKRIEKNDR